MPKVIFNISMSLDGFITGPRQTKEAPLGANGESLHDWVFNGGPENAAYFERIKDGNGAVICGRTCYDDSLPFWGEGGPTGEQKLPLFVVTHRPLTKSHSTGIYHAAQSLNDAIAQATAAADGKTISLMGGANIARQAIAQGLVDEIELHVVPVLFGGGTRLFETLPEEIRLEPTFVVDTKQARHVAYRVIK